MRTVESQIDGAELELCRDITRVVKRPSIEVAWQGGDERARAVGFPRCNCPCRPAARTPRWGSRSGTGRGVGWKARSAPAASRDGPHGSVPAPPIGLSSEALR